MSKSLARISVTKKLEADRVVVRLHPEKRSKYIRAIAIRYDHVPIDLNIAMAREAEMSNVQGPTIIRARIAIDLGRLRPGRHDPLCTTAAPAFCRER